MKFLQKFQKQDGKGNGFLDVDVLQGLQDRFCKAFHVYMFCLGRENRLITSFYGEQEEIEFLDTVTEQDAIEAICSKMEVQNAQVKCEMTGSRPYLKHYLLPVHISGDVQMTWVITALLEEKMTGLEELPEGMLLTRESYMADAMEYLEGMSRQLFAIKLEENIAQEAVLASAEAEREAKEQLNRSETMTQILKMLESEHVFGKIANDILREVCETLNISEGVLIGLKEENQALESVCQYARESRKTRTFVFEGRAKKDVPFFNGKNYLVSSRDAVPEAVQEFFDEMGMSAAVFLPVEVSDKPTMYLCFFDVDEPREWSERDLKFLNDTKRIVQSILSKQLAKDSLASSYEALEAILENVGCGIYVCDQKKQALLYSNQRFRELFRHVIAENRLEAMLFSEKEQKRFKYFEEVYVVEEEKWFDMNKTMIKWVDGREVSLCTVYDVTDKKLYQKRIEKQANNDFLTGLFNRMRCEKDLERMIREAKREEKEGALLYIDLDDFKHINDGLGHQYGDVLLKAISNSLKRIPGVENHCYRMGGDEFIVMVTPEKFQDLERIVGDIQKMFQKPWYLKGEDYFCTMSMGIVCFPTDADAVDEVIRKADLALYSAKRRGKNCAEVYNDKEEGSSFRRLDIEKNMRKATLNACTEFEVYYQPIMDVSNGKEICAGAEALVRWNSSEMGFISPSDFIPVAEYLGLINPIGEYVLNQAVRQCKYWNETGHPNFKVNVNLSVVQLLQNDIVKKIQKALKESGINPSNLRLEVTESLAVDDMDRMKMILGQIKSLGVGVALDDFGTGYSSLNHIREMPIDVIKIDRCFIEHIREDDFSDAFVKMVAELAGAIGVNVCVEGVENKRQFDFIKKMKIKYIQGYYFGKPVPLKEFEKKYL